MPVGRRKSQPRENEEGLVGRPTVEEAFWAFSIRDPDACGRSYSGYPGCTTLTRRLHICAGFPDSWEHWLLGAVVEIQTLAAKSTVSIFPQDFLQFEDFPTS